MARVLLVQPPHRDTFGYSMPPLGPLHLGAAARQAGHDVQFLDLALAVRRGDLAAGAELLDRCADELLAREPDVLGLTSMLSSLPAALLLARNVKTRRPDLPVLLGGQGPETVEEEVIERYPSVDVVAVGEADRTLTELLEVWDAPEAWSGVPGVVVRAGPRHGGGLDAHGLPTGPALRSPPRALLADLDEVCTPAWDLAEPPRAYAEAAGEEAALFPIDLGRGCSHACSFCTTPVFWGRRARHLSPARAVDELDRLAALGDIDCVYVTHDLFTFDRQRVLEICAEKQRRGNQLAWECRTRLDLVDEELLATMAEAGCRRILYGVESIVPRQLAAMDKGGRQQGMDAEAVLSVLEVAQRAGVASIVGTMTGLPGETRAELESNLAFMARAAQIDGVSLSMHWWNVTPGNGRAAEVPGDVRLVPGVSADLVRGYDIPAGETDPETAALIAEDETVFGAFRVHLPPDEHGGEANPSALYRRSRNAHLLIEVFPRTFERVGRTGSIADTLDDFLVRACALELPGAEPADLAEPSVLTRAGAVRLFAAWCESVDANVALLARYEAGLATTETTALHRFPDDPRALFTDRTASEPAPTDILFVRRGDSVQATALSPFLADVAEGLDDDELRRRWPGTDPDSLADAHNLLHRLAT